MAVNFEVSTPVFNIQTYCIHDGPGIRTTVFVKGCPLRCLWCANPESQSDKPQLMTYSAKCTGCGRCVERCHQGAVELEPKDDKVIAVTNRGKCVLCGECVEACWNDAREIVGDMTTVRQAFEKVMGDKMFYDASGGGMTISGGEALMHPDFSSNLLEACQEAGIHTAVETCSYASRAAVDKVFSHVDLGLMDIKHMDSAEHKRLTGVPNETILENIAHVYHDMHVPVIVRVPTIPGCNDSPENIAETADFVLEELGIDVQVHLLPYHRLGISKSESMGREHIFACDPPSNEHMEGLLEIVKLRGLKCQIGG